VTGKEKGIRNQESLRRQGFGGQAGIRNYVAYEFLDVKQMAEALNTADLVITRAGMGVLSELSYLGKPSIIIPLPGSHQEDNAEFFRNKKAAIVVKQKYLTPENFTQMVKDLLSDEKSRGQLAMNMGQAMKKGAVFEIAEIVRKILNQ